MLRRCSLFALPLFQNEGYVTMLCQFAGCCSIVATVFVFTTATGDSFVLVPLQSVKDEGEAAKPWLMVRRLRLRCLPLHLTAEQVSYYDDLAADKGVV
jgi:hypothetical protein